MLFVWNTAFSQINDSAKHKDVMITEIFADPNPPVGLPPVEFIELWNSSKHPISLKGWLYNDANSTFKFSDDSIQANEYLIICAKADTTLLKPYGRMIGISPWPSLNNNSDRLTLKTATGYTIDEVDYTDAWYQNALKRNGGWSLELIDPKSLCSGLRNWQASMDSSGGSPGKRNSVYKLFDTLPGLRIAGAWLVDSLTIGIKYNRYTDSLTAVAPQNYSVNNGLGPPVNVNLQPFDLFTVLLKFDRELKRGISYLIKVENVLACNGEVIKPPSNTAELFVPKKISPGDILISEILFNPRATGVDFVELYNPGDQTLDLQELSISNSLVTDPLKPAKRLVNSQLLLNPKEYLVLTSDPDKVKTEYFSKNPDGFFRLAIPAYNNESGTVSIFSGNVLIDQLSYTEKMHHPLIKNADGVSLERANFSKPANHPGNFLSAAASVGFATPAYQNSQTLTEDLTIEEFTLKSPTFSPNDDGFEDRMQISYRLKKPGFVVNLTIFDDRGMVIRKLYKNFLIGAEGEFIWDGRNEASTLVPAGIYLIYAEMFNQEGELKKFRKPIVLAQRLN